MDQSANTIGVGFKILSYTPMKSTAISRNWGGFIF